MEKKKSIFFKSSAQSPIKLNDIEANMKQLKALIMPS